LWLSPEGHGLDHLDPGGAIDHGYRQFAYVSEAGARETIEVTTEIQFFATDNGARLDMGSASYTGTYQRSQGQKVFSLRSACADPKPYAPISIRQFQRLDSLEKPFSNEEILFYILDSLKRIASGPDKPEKRWLRKFVAQCKDTPEKRALQALLR